MTIGSATTQPNALTQTALNAGSGTPSLAGAAFLRLRDELDGPHRRPARR